MTPTASSVIRELRGRANPRNVAGMARFGVHVENALGIPAPVLHAMARRIGKDHSLAAGLWDSRIHEARILAALIDEPRLVTRRQMEQWVREFDSWDVCDGVCGYLFDRTPFAYEKAVAWSARKGEFVKRAGFALMAWRAVHDRQAADARFIACLPIIEREASDPRNFVKKAVNWALRQIGKRNARLRRAAMGSARRIRRQGSTSARWIAADALRELSALASSRRTMVGRRKHCRRPRAK